EVDTQIIADSSVTLPLLAEAVASKADRQKVQARSEEIGAAHREQRKRWQEEVRKDWDASPISTGRLASEVWDAIKGEDWVLTANTLEEWSLKLWDFDKPYRHPGKSLGTSTQIGISLGVALAHKGTGRLVV